MNEELKKLRELEKELYSFLDLSCDNLIKIPTEKDLDKWFLMIDKCLLNNSIKIRKKMLNLTCIINTIFSILVNKKDEARREERERIIKILVNQFKLKQIAKLFNEEEFLKDAPDDVKKIMQIIKKK